MVPKKVLFIGGFFSKDKESFFYNNSIGHFQFAANTFQWSFIQSLLDSVQLSLITLPFLGNYPKSYKYIISRSFKFEYGNKSHTSIGNIHLPIFGLIIKTIRLYKELKHSRYNEISNIIIYSLYTPFILATLLHKISKRDIKICVIVPDLPHLVSSSKNYIYIYSARLNSFILKLLSSRIDNFVFVTKDMADYFNVDSSKWALVEGIYTDLDLPNCSSVSNHLDQNNFNIFYSGTLDRRYGIANLLKTFSILTDKSLRLFICGEGNMKESVLDFQTKDHRIVYLGQIPRESVLQFQRDVDLLINPRTSEGIYTSYSFPIKTMEYLASGTPVIMNYLPGVPEEYVEFINIPKDESIQSLSELILKIKNDKSFYYKNKSNEARDFILTKKSGKYQASKILKLISSNS